MNTSPVYWAVVPAAGTGTRMGADIPKQYLSLHGKTILEHALNRLLQFEPLAGVIVAINPNDELWPGLSLAGHPKIATVEGGNERSESVLNGLRAIGARARENDWVLVHDAARPCIQVDSIQRLCEAVKKHATGGLLGVPVSDTLKRVAHSGAIQDTVERRALWHAQTPQMFRLGALKKALEQALAEAREVTDEASALEAMGQRPLMVEGRRDNIKITRPEDLAMAELILQLQALDQE